MPNVSSVTSRHIVDARLLSSVVVRQFIRTGISSLTLTLPISLDLTLDSNSDPNPNPNLIPIPNRNPKPSG